MDAPVRVDNRPATSAIGVQSELDQTVRPDASC